MHTECTYKKHPHIDSILFADDDCDDQFFFREALLAIAPFIQLDVAQNAEELQNHLKQKTPGLIFLSPVLPGNTGHQCLRKIKRDPRFQNTPVVMLSTFNGPVDENTAYHLGADLYFKKPFSYTDLKSGLKDVLSFNWKDASEAN